MADEIEVDSDLSAEISKNFNVTALNSYQKRVVSGLIDSKDIFVCTNTTILH